MATYIGGTYKTTKPTPVYEYGKKTDPMLAYVPSPVVIDMLPKGTIVKPTVTNSIGWITDKGIIHVVDTKSLIKVTESGLSTKLIGSNSVVSAGLQNKTYLYALGAILIFAYLVKSKKIKL